MAVLKQAKFGQKDWTARTDVQVISLVAGYTLFAIIVVSQIYWKLSFEVMMSSLENRVFSLYEAMEERIDPKTFYDINDREDMYSDLYRDNIEIMTGMKNTAGVLYFFTAKEDENGEFIYVLDGLEQHKDFRYPSDKIEEQIVPKMQRALQGEIVLPEQILHTDWGDIFMAYLPFHDKNGEVIGVVGVEFDATETYATLTLLRTYTPSIAFVLVVSAIFISAYLFKRISNPLYLDQNTKDAPTGFKNRNAYEVDLNNLIARGHSQNIGVIVADINGLKQVNDRLGHEAGDRYISLVAQAIHATKENTMVGYRTGGDEFVIFMQDATEETLKKFVEICTSRVKSQKSFSDMRCSLACGYCLFDEKLDKTLQDTFNRADELMYIEKRRQKEAEER